MLQPVERMDSPDAQRRNIPVLLLLTCAIAVVAFSPPTLLPQTANVYGVHSGHCMMTMVNAILFIAYAKSGISAFREVMQLFSLMGAFISIGAVVRDPTVPLHYIFIDSAVVIGCSVWYVVMSHV